MEKKKMGRPTDAPKTNSMMVRLSNEEVHLLETCCQHTGLSKADVIRLGIREIYSKLNK